MTDEPWAAHISKVVAGEVRRYRQLRGLSAQQLSDACGQLGHPIARSVLANFESGRRPTVSVAELLVFARALEVPPILLIFPLGREETIEVLPGESAPVWRALKWFTGEDDWLPAALPGLADEQDSETMRLYREHEKFEDDWFVYHRRMLAVLGTMTDELDQHRSEPDPRAVDHRMIDVMQHNMRGVEEALTATRQDMVNRELTPPELPPELAHIEAPDDRKSRRRP